MKMHFDHFHDFARRIVPDFGLLRVDRHRIDLRAATSIVIVCMALAMALMVTMTLTQPVRRAPPKSAEQVAPPPAADKVTIVAATPKLDMPCAEQTWPYIDRRCLTETTQKRPQSDGRREATAASADAPKAASPAAPAVATPLAETQGIAPPDVPAGAQAEEPQPMIVDTSEQAELAEDDDIPHPLPALSERELRHLERMERRRAAQERRMRHPHFQLPIFGRIF